VDDDPGPTTARPLPRSLDPLQGESLQGFLLRLSCRLRIAPLHLARLTGCAAASSPAISRQSMIGLGTETFAHATRLTTSEADALTLVPWAARYPPIGGALSRSSPGRSAIRESWLFSPGIRYCPSCLRGDGSPVQEQYGGPWRKYWLLPVAFACPQHRMLLMDDCPHEHSPAEQGNWQLIRRAADSALHPAQCRRPAPAAGRGPGSPACGARLDLAGTGDSEPIPASPDTQQRLLSLLTNPHTAEAAASTFTDIRVVTALLCDSWPLGQELMDPRMAAAVGRHVRRLNVSSYRPLARPPGDVLSAAGLLTAAVTILDSPDLAGTVARHVQTRKAGSPSKSSWARVLDRHHCECSAALRDAAEPATRVYRRTAGPNSRKAPSRAVGYRPGHIPALLPQDWFDEHLACLGYRVAKSMRRAGAVILVQWAAGGSMGDAASYLGIRAPGSAHQYAPDLAQWLRDHGPDDFTAALRSLAAQLDSARSLINYQRRRQAMREWCLDPGTWQQLTSRLAPVPGPVQPILDDRKRQEASAFTWAYITQGEPRFAPHPIQDSQPESVQREWARNRSSTWSLLARPGRFVHYAELRKLLIEHGDRLAKDIDYSG
jgi:TniQ